MPPHYIQADAPYVTPPTKDTVLVAFTSSSKMRRNKTKPTRLPTEAEVGGVVRLRFVGCCVM